jgi:hypothetical protein
MNHRNVVPNRKIAAAAAVLKPAITFTFSSTGVVSPA